MLRTTIIIATISALVSFSEAKAESACKGLDLAKCGEAKASCYWQPEIVAGQPKTSKPDETYAVSRKAHCRARPAPKPETDKPATTG